MFMARLGKESASENKEVIGFKVFSHPKPKFETNVGAPYSAGKIAYLHKNKCIRKVRKPQTKFL